MAKSSAAAVDFSTPESHSERSVPYLPLEILQNIAKSLDIESARNLARSSRDLRDAGESRIWESLDLTSGWNESKAGLLRRTTEATSARRADVVASKLRHASNSLGSHPFRASCVKEIRVEPLSTSITAPSAYPLLERFATQINKLHILPVDSGDFHLFPVDSTPLILPQLYYLKYDRQYNGPTLLNWISHQSQLDTLELSVATGKDDSAPVRFPPEVMLDQLCDLSFDGLRYTHGEPPKSHDHLAELLDISPCLDFLHLSGYWRPIDNDPVLLAMAANTFLSTLVLSHEGSDATALSSTPGVRYWRLGKVDITVRWIVVKIDCLYRKEKWYDNAWADSNYIRLPRSQDLERLTILTDYQPLSYPSPIDHTPHIAEFLSDRFIHELRKAPRVTTIAVAHIPQSLSSLSDSLFVGESYDTSPSAWAADGVFGTIIRQYTNPSDSAEVLWHARGLYPRDNRTSTRSWRDYTRYKGAVVPREVLEKVYEAAGEELEFSSGGRGLPLGDAAWAILRGLEGTSGDEVDLDYETEGSEDDRYEPDGYDESGRDEDGYDEEGRDYSGYDQEGFDELGINRAGKDRRGYDMHSGLNDEGVDEDGYDWRGFDKAGRRRNE